MISSMGFYIFYMFTLLKIRIIFWIPRNILTTIMHSHPTINNRIDLPSTSTCILLLSSTNLNRYTRSCNVELNYLSLHHSDNPLLPTNVCTRLKLAQWFQRRLMIVFNVILLESPYHRMFFLPSLVQICPVVLEKKPPKM